jgi:molecular chaperone DnaK
MPISEHHPLLGMDLGTTYSAVAKWDGREPKMVVPAEGGETTPSAFFYASRDNEVVIGRTARTRGILQPEGLVLGAKRLMDNGSQSIKVAGREFTPVEISSEILKKLYYDEAHRYPRNTFSSSGTVVTVPYYFMAHQCESTRRAAELADINLIGIIQEPIAASLAYAWQRVLANPTGESRETILVFDSFRIAHNWTRFEIRGTGN